MSVAVVSWNTRELLVRCLQSLEPAVREGTADVWVVDNGSIDGSAEAARQEAPWATVLEPSENLGFGRAVNEVARCSHGPWLVAANADIALEPRALEVMLAVAQDPQVGCVAPRLVLPDGETQHSVHSLPTLTFTLMFNLGVQNLSRRLADRMMLPGFRHPERVRDVPWAIGAFLLLRRSAFDAVGGFDDRQWMYAEDLDLGWRLRDGGWVTRYAPDARVLHESSAATEQAFGDRKVTRFMEATYEMLLWRSRPRAVATAVVGSAGALARLAWLIPLARRSPDWANRATQMRTWLAAHHRGLRQSLGLDRAP